MPHKDPIKRKEYKQKHDAMRPKEKRRKRNMEHKEEYDRAYQSSYHSMPVVKAHVQSVRRAKYANDRMIVLNHYSNGNIKCNCCGENTLEFMALDHLNGNGADHRRAIGKKNIYRWIKKNNFPAEFQILCHNCNTAKGVNKICPHQLNGQTAVNPEDLPIIDFSYMG